MQTVLSKRPVSVAVHLSLSCVTPSTGQRHEADLWKCWNKNSFQYSVDVHVSEPVPCVKGKDPAACLSLRSGDGLRVRHWSPCSLVAFWYTIGTQFLFYKISLDSISSVTKTQAVLINPPCNTGKRNSQNWISQPFAHFPFFCGATLIMQLVWGVVMESESLSLRLPPSSVSFSRLFWLLWRIFVE